MSSSIYYAQLIGLWLVIVHFAMLVYPDRFKKMLQESTENLGLITLTGLASLAGGLLIVLFHNIWIFDWPVLITLFGWFLILHGCLKIYAPQKFIKNRKENLPKKNYYYGMTMIWLVVGVILIYNGFFNH